MSKNEEKKIPDLKPNEEEFMKPIDENELSPAMKKAYRKMLERRVKKKES